MFVPSLTRGEDVPYRTFLNDAAAKWRSLSDEEKQKFRDIHSANVAEYRTRMDAWMAGKEGVEAKLELKEKSRKKGSKIRQDEAEKEEEEEEALAVLPRKRGSVKLDKQTVPPHISGSSLTTTRSKANSTTDQDNDVRKDISRPLRPRNPFFVFKDSVEKSDNVPHKDFVKILANKWAKMTEEEKQPYRDAARQNYDAYVAVSSSLQICTMKPT